MDLRTLNKLFVLNNALEKYNKRNDVKLTLSSLFILYAVKQLSKNCGCTFSRLDLFLRQNTHTNSRNKLHKCLMQFSKEGFVKIQGSNLKFYELNLVGCNFLNEVEKRIRIERIKFK